MSSKPIRRAQIAPWPDLHQPVHAASEAPYEFTVSATMEGYEPAEARVDAWSRRRRCR
jgi:hypothetical protein